MCITETTSFGTSWPAAAEIRLFGLGPWLVEESGRLWEPIAQHQLAFAARFAGSRMAADGANVVAYVITLAFGVWLASAGRLA
ncbi:MAG: hypothetical protein ACR2NO_00320 [Chloroflexota bacterium]